MGVYERLLKEYGKSLINQVCEHYYTIGKHCSNKEFECKCKEIRRANNDGKNN